MKQDLVGYRGSWAVVILCAVVVVAEGYDLIVYGTLIPSLQAEPGWELDKASAGTIGSLVYVGMLIGSVVSGRLSDLYGRRKLALTSIAWFTAWTAACALATSATQLGAFRLLAGIGMGGVLPCLLALAKEHSPEGRTSLAVTVMMAGLPLGGTGASLLALAILDQHGWRFMFWIGVAVSLGILAVAWWLLPESDHFQGEMVSAARPMRDLFARQFLLLTALFTAATFLNILTTYGLNTWLTALMHELDYPLSSALQFSMTFNIGAVLGSFLVAYLGDRFGTRLMALIATAVTALAIALIATGPTHTAALLVAVAVMGMGGHSSLIQITSSVANAYPVEIRATALGWTTGTGRLGAIVSPWLGGTILAAGVDPRTLFWTFCVSSCLAGVLLIVLFVMGRSPASESVIDDGNVVSDSRLSR